MSRKKNIHGQRMFIRLFRNPVFNFKRHGASQVMQSQTHTVSLGQRSFPFSFSLSFFPTLQFLEVL